MAVYDIDSVDTELLVANDIINCDYSGAARDIILRPGTYKLECWGAQGGDYNSTNRLGGKGGYSVGTLTISEENIFYLYAGGAGIKTSAVSTAQGGGFNGGGNAYTTSNSYLMCGGGGASDVRIGQDSLYSRVIVAGGGGAGTYFNSTGGITGGHGGGLTGEDAYDYATSYLGGNGGTQTTAGASYYGTTVDSTSYGILADFGNGGSAISGGYVSGGGGGWYGGGCSSMYGAGGGGSGYVYTSSTASDYPEGCLLNSTYYLTDASTENAIREGNGYIQITVLDVNSINAKVKIGGVWKDINSIYMKVGGEWKAANGLKVKTNGSWRDSS